jgi:glucose/arabinose dehydrogenase
LGLGWAFALGPAPLAAADLRSDQGLAQPPDVQITVDTVIASGLERPVQVIHAGDGSGRLFVVEQPGRIQIVQDGTTLSQPFLDVTDLVLYGGERGLLGLAFHPDYPSNGYFYVNYTRVEDGATVIARYGVSVSNPARANPNSAMVLLAVDQPETNHNGGQLLFSPVDGYLYIGMGDGGGGGDPFNNAQDASTLLGAMLRLDVDSATPYAIPPDNPYVGVDGRDEIWAIGLRNPWRFSFDRDNGDLYIGDVGQNEWEEIDYQTAATPGGLNFGWPCKEGSYEYDFSGDCGTVDLTDPIAEYSHDDGRSVTGGFVYRGQDYPALAGRYFYADYVFGRIWSLYRTGSNPDTWSTPDLELETGLNISAFGQDEQGELYVVDHIGGTIRRLAPSFKAFLPLILGRP